MVSCRDVAFLMTCVYGVFSYFYIYKLPLYYLHVADFKCCALNLRKQEHIVDIIHNLIRPVITDYN